MQSERPQSPIHQACGMGSSSTGEGDGGAVDQTCRVIARTWISRRDGESGGRCVFVPRPELEEAEADGKEPRSCAAGERRTGASTMERGHEWADGQGRR
jgi:hypothetical protein